METPLHELAMADAIVALVEARDFVTFAELDRLVAGFKGEPDNEMTICLGPKILWVASKAGQAALCRVWDEGRVCASSASTLTYLVDGVMLQEKDWLPLVLRPGRFTNFHTPPPGNLAFFLEPKILKSVSRKRKKK